jgi:L-gulono-1,4-lactone dehydrogenase
MKVRTRAGWQNTIRKYKVTPVKLFEPESLADIVTIIREAESKKLKVRAVGSGHSFSDVAVVREYLVDLYRLKKVEKYDTSIIKEKYSNKQFVNSEAGIRVRDLNIALTNMCLALKNMGAFDKQKLGGVIATGTHGTGKDIEAMQGFVHSILLVASEGKVYRIEKTDGITNPASFKEPGVELIQNDDIFYSTVLSFGSMGIIHSLVIEVEPLFFLRETKIQTNWEDLKKEWLDGTIFTKGDEESAGKPPRSVSFLINPYPLKNKKSKKEEHFCIVSRHYEATKPQKWKLIEASRNLISYIFGNFPVTYFYTMFIFNTLPHRAPFLIRGSLKSLRDKKFVHRSHKVLFQGFQFIKQRAYDAEFAFNLYDTPKAIATIDEIIATAKTMKDDSRLYHSSPLGVRFVKASEAFLATEYHRNVAYIDTPFLLRTHGTETMLEKCQQIMFEKGGIPHWGKSNSILDGKPEFLTATYPKLDTWKATLKKFNPSGTFNNHFMERIGLI